MKVFSGQFGRIERMKNTELVKVRVYEKQSREATVKKVGGENGAWRGDDHDDDPCCF